MRQGRGLEGLGRGQKGGRHAECPKDLKPTAMLRRPLPASPNPPVKPAQPPGSPSIFSFFFFKLRTENKRI